MSDGPSVFARYVEEPKKERPNQQFQKGRYCRRPSRRLIIALPRLRNYSTGS